MERKNHHRRTHGKSKTRLYYRWKAMIRRCENKNTFAYKDYGGRGISVCKRWRYSFENFIQDMGSCPDGFSLERIDNNGNYEPSNCTWASWRTQANNVRSNRILIYNGSSKTMTEWSRLTGIKVGTIWKRLELGWSDEKAIFHPLR